MTNQITGGSVRIKDGLKAAVDYGENRVVEVTISYAVADPAEAAIQLNLAAKMADDKVNQLLGRKPAGTVAETPAPKEKPAAKPKAEAKPKPPADEVVEDEDEGGDVVVEDETVSEEKPVEETKDDADMSEFEVEPEATITDADLNKAVQAKNAEISSPPKIKALIATFNPDPTKPFALAQIKAEQRADFLAKLEKLTKE